MASTVRLKAAAMISEYTNRGIPFDGIVEALPQYSPLFIRSVAAQFRLKLTGVGPDRIRVLLNPKSRLWVCQRGTRVVIVHRLWTEVYDAALRLADADRRAAGGKP